MSAEFGSDAITPEDLIAYADGDANAGLIARIESDPALMTAAAGYRHAERRLHRRLYRFRCPSPQTLGEYDLGLLPPALQTRIAAHVVDCPLCARELQSLRTFLADESPVPLGLTTRARRLIATLLPPSRQPAGIRLRGAGDEVSRAYQADGFMMSLTVTPATRRGGASLVGLLWRDDASADASLAGSAMLTGAGSSHTGEIDALGNFTFDALPPGTYHLDITLGDDSIVVEAIRVE